MTTSDNPSQTTSVAGALAFVASVGDPSGTRTVTAIVALLAVLGVGLVMVAIWLFRLTRPDKELLAPLEVMGERKWRRADPVWQRRRLDQVRPSEAQPLQPSAAPPDFDEAFDHGPTVSGFDDLHDAALVPPPVKPTPAPATPPASVESPQSVATEVTSTAVQNGDVGAPAAAAAAAPEAPKDGDRQPTSPREAVAPTPIGIERPLDLPDHDIDPDVMAAAMAELDAELGLGRETQRPSAE